MNFKINKTPIGKNLSIVHNSRNISTLYIDGVGEGWEQYILVTSDRHHDAVDCNRELELEHLEMARKRNAFVVDVGDLYDVMQGKFDPRRSYSNLRPEYKADNYLDEVVREAAQFYGPYADRFLILGRGNHESSILKNHGIDLTGNLVHRLNSDHGGHIQDGGYGGWLRILFKISTKQESILLKYFHGAGSANAQVTRDVINSNRQAVYLPDADIIVNGHHHESWYVPIKRERISSGGVVYQDIQHHIRTATYKDDYGDGYGGWHVESGKPPKPIGAAWIHLYFHDERHSNRNAGTRMIKIEPILEIN